MRAGGGFDTLLQPMSGAGATQQLTSLAAATNLTPPLGSTHAIIQCEGASVRWWPNSTPTATVGHLLTADTYLMYDYDLASIQFIQASSGAILNVSYFKRI